MCPSTTPASSNSERSEFALGESPTGLLVCDEAAVIQFSSPRIDAIFGHSAKELKGTSIESLLPDLAGDLPAFRNGSNGGRHTEIVRVLSGRRRDGSEIRVEVGLAVAECNGRQLLVATVVDAAERLQSAEEERSTAERRLAFERMVSRLAARFVNLPPDQVDDAIVDSLRQIVLALDIDRSALWQFTEDGQDVHYTHMWALPDLSSPPPQVSLRERLPWFLEKIRAQQTLWIESLTEVPEPMDRENLRLLGNKSTAVIPLVADDQVIGALSFGALRSEKRWTPNLRSRLLLMGAVFSHALARRSDQLRLQRAHAEVVELRRQLARENARLREEVTTLTGPRAIAAESPSVRSVLEQIESVAATEATVLLLGETGVGKEVFAEAIHDRSHRRRRPMVRVNCAAIPGALLESELFGRERGAYTGALSQQIGRFELASGSTLFLDEIGELPLESQVKLLRAVQDRVVERLGGVRPVKVDVRLIAATNRNLERAVADRTFREDLYYRLNVFPIRIPPLRERREDIPVLVWAFVEEFSRMQGKRIDSVAKESMAELMEHSWPGNVRELRNLIERAVILARGPRLSIHVHSHRGPVGGKPSTLQDVETAHIRSALEQSGWRVRGPGGAAERLGLKPTTLDSRMARLGIRRPER